MPLQLSERYLMTASVNSCQPMRLWEVGRPAWTVRTLLSSSTPWRAHFSKTNQILASQGKEPIDWQL